MLKISERLERIIHKYLPNKYKANNNDLIYSKVYSILQEKCLKKNVAMWGVGDFNNPSKTYVSKFLETFADSLQNTKCLIDMRQELKGKELLGLPIILPQEISKYDIDVILVTSYRSRKYIVDEIRKFCPDISYVDVYEELERMDLPTDTDIFMENDKYVNLYYQRKLYENALNTYDQEIQFEKLILMYADIKDVNYICRLIDECDIDDIQFIKKMNDLKAELTSLLGEIREEIHNKKDIVVWLQDAFRECDWYDNRTSDFKILKNISQKSVCFVNSYATGPVTYESFYSIITGKMPFEGKVYDSKFKFDIKDFEFFKNAIDDNYKIRFYTDERFDIFNPDTQLKTKLKKYMPEIIWGLLSEMCENDSKILHFAYAFKELHVPFMCGYFSNEPVRSIFSKMGLDEEEIKGEDIKRQFEDCLNYMDYEMENFLSLLGEDTVVIILGDHAHIVYDEKENKPFYLYYNDLNRSVRNTFMIYKKSWKHKVYKDLVSLIDFNKITSQVFEEKSFILPKRDKINYQYYPVQNITIRENAKLFNGEDYIDGIECCYDGEYIKVTTPNKIETYTNNNQN